jgi:hypothetical protein
MAYSKKPSSKGKKNPKNGGKNNPPKTPEKRNNDTGCMRKCEPDAETEKHYEKIGTMTCASHSSKSSLFSLITQNFYEGYTVTCHDGRSTTIWWRRNCRKTLLQAEDFCARSD